MILYRILTLTCAAALAAGAAHAQTAAPPTPGATAAAPAAAKGDIVETARSAGQFSTFLKAVEATNLTSVLKTNGNLTVFAPTDAAFAALPAGELDKLMLPENRASLQKLLTYHIVNARVDSTKIRGAKGPVPTVAGPSVELDGSGEKLMVNDADITRPDMIASNGVIHVVDKVLTPGAVSASASGAAASASAAGTAAKPPAAPASPPQ
jgi:uncharacterized surface protein with fasciclin (FAS1) repeats